MRYNGKVCTLILYLMSLIRFDKQQSHWHAETNTRAIVDVGRLPFDRDPVLELLHRLWMMRGRGRGRRGR